MKVRDVMNKDVAFVRSDATLADAARLMWERDCGFTPILEPGTEQVVGVVTDRDICIATYTQGRAPAAIPVGVAMARRVISCRDDDDVAAAHAQMRTHQVRRVPVLDKFGRLVGVVSLNDLARRAFQESSTAARREVAETLAEVCRPRALVPI